MQTMKQQREALGFNQVELADALGVSQTAVSRMEAGKMPISRRTELALEALRMKAAAVAETVSA